MPLGAGKYNEQLSEALKACEAIEGILIVLDGKEGPSFCCQLSAKGIERIPRVLRIMADQIEKEGGLK